MHSSSDAACKCTSLQPSERANQFSFPPTQRFGLLDSTNAHDADTNSGRSEDQRENLQESFKNLLDELKLPQSTKEAA